jgi:hypothetical protein
MTDEPPTNHGLGQYTYTITTDALTVDGHFFPADSFTFIRQGNETTASLAGLSFGGFPLSTATTSYGGLILSIDAAKPPATPPYGWPPLGVPELGGLGPAAFLTVPTVDGIPITTHTPISVVVDEYVQGNGYYETIQYQGYSQGSVTVTASNLPEPGTFLLLALGLVALLLLWRVERFDPSQRTKIRGLGLVGLAMRRKAIVPTS